MTQTTFAAPDFADVAGCSNRYARWWLRRHVANYPEGHVRMDGGQFLSALTKYNEHRAALRAARLAQMRVGKCASPPKARRYHSGALHAAVLDSYARTGSVTQAARETGCPPRTARRWIHAQGGADAKIKARHR